LIRLPAAYEDNEGGLNRLTLMPQRGGKIKIIGNFRMASLGNARDIFFISTGTWRDGDRLVFSFHENETKDRGEGIFQFLGPDKAVLHLSYTFKSDPKKEADARNFNAKNLSFLRDADRKPWEIAGIGEESEEQ
jgi:hypothetical protein